MQQIFLLILILKIQVHYQTGLLLKELRQMYSKFYQSKQLQQINDILCKDQILILRKGLNKLNQHEQVDLSVKDKGLAIEEYLQENSKKYKKIYDINLLAQGSEATVYRVEHQDVEEVVIKQQIQALNENYDMMLESSQLKILDNYNYIAQVKEEIIEIDTNTMQIQKYCVTVERARFTLEDLIQIWNDPQLSSKYFEFYSPEKLFYYFYQIVQILAFFHQNNVYYGDMKPENLLVFRNQLIKIGDLGISIKMNDDSPDEEYLLKGYSEAFTTPKIIQAAQQRTKLSKRDLITADKNSLFKTFKYIMSQVKDFKKDKSNKYSKLIEKLVLDLGKSVVNWKDPLSKLVQTYQDIILESNELCLALITQFSRENKTDYMVHLTSLTQYKYVIADELIRKTAKGEEDDEEDDLNHGDYERFEILRAPNELEIEKSKHFIKVASFEDNSDDSSSSSDGYGGGNNSYGDDDYGEDNNSSSEPPGKEILKNTKGELLINDNEFKLIVLELIKQLKVTQLSTINTIPLNPSFQENFDKYFIAQHKDIWSCIQTNYQKLEYELMYINIVKKQKDRNAQYLQYAKFFDNPNFPPTDNFRKLYLKSVLISDSQVTDKRRDWFIFKIFNLLEHKHKQQDKQNKEEFNYGYLDKGYEQLIGEEEEIQILKLHLEQKLKQSKRAFQLINV
eukprot:403354395